MASTPQDVRAIFTEAIGKKTPEEQTAYLDAACGSDDRLRAEVESLVTAHRDAGSFLRVLLEDQDSVAANNHSPLLTEGPGTVIGRYKLLEKIGEGGMAVVYMAEQTEPIHRKVALKIIKLGMDTRQVIARFEAERQALALMDHPCIAKVLDAGATETGRPYFVMELVQGVSITEYCDKNSLSTKDRLALFLQVCHAVQHAHQKGIIHRDIKPSNVMVTHHDGKPVPKVIDFGIAKATDQKLTEKTLFTHYAHIIGTPAYMSPEQAELSDLDIDTRSDVYSLGVLLYELLTGTTPFSEEELRKAGYIEMQRVIREQEPVKPSTKLSTLGETLTDIAKCRNCTPDRLRKTVRGDLDWIVMKSLEKDRVRRYETASGLAEDVRRHLEHEPVLVRGPSTGYRLGKFLRRHRSQVLTVLAMAMAVSAGIVAMSLWSRNRRQLAETEGFKHRNILSQAQEQYARADRSGALETLKPILRSRQAGPEAQLLYASILVEGRQPDEAVTMLKGLLDARPEIAGAAHSLLARILWESGPLDAGRLKEIDNHRRQAEASLSETAEAYFLQAITAVTVKEQLALLDRALELDATHYESRRLRAFLYYASRKYEKMEEDALGMTILRQRDPLGYSLRAIALSELRRYVSALATYDKAIALTSRESPQYTELHVQRCEVLLRMGDCKRAVADARRCLDLWPDRPVFQYNMFYALTAAGDYGEADAVFQRIVHSGPGSQSPFQDACTRYVFESLRSERPWHPADREPGGRAFLPMLEAEDVYHQLSAKGAWVTGGGFNAQWSPDGKKLAFSMGVHGYSGVAIYDPATKETELLIVPGKDPTWSPNGQYIAFVRDCQALRVAEFATAERKNQHRALEAEEVWVMKSNGTEPKRLARGYCPAWSQDSTQIYYQSRTDNVLYSLPIIEPDAQPKRIMAGLGSFAAVSPDNQRVAYLDGSRLKVKDLGSQALVAEWPVPVSTGGRPAWAPTGRELCLAGRHDSDDATGLWVFCIGQNEPLRILGGRITAASWARNGTKLAFALGSPYFDIWAADLDPRIPIVEALGPARTGEQYSREMVALYTRRIRTDAQDASAYFDRARCYDYLHERTKADADMKRWSVVMSGRSRVDTWFDTLRDRRHVINLPFDCEFVFSAERPANAIPIMSVAFGQKGRCEMRLFKIPAAAMSFLGFVLFSGLDAPPAHASFTFGEPTNLGPNINTPVEDGGLCISPDGLELYFSSLLEGLSSPVLRVSRRETTDAPWLEATCADSSLQKVYSSCMSADGLSLYFDSLCSGGCGDYDIWVATRASLSDSWAPPVNLGPKVNSFTIDIGPSITADGLELYFGSVRSGGSGNWDIWVSKRATVSDPWGQAVNLGPMVNSPAFDGHPFITPDGLVLFFTSPRPGGYGDWDIWMTRRASRDGDWGTPVNLGPSLNTAAGEAEPYISADGRTFYFSDWYIPRPGGVGKFDLWQAPIIPIVDFNSDGKVDAKDLGLLADNWGKSTSLYDIGPFAWGDGVVDEKDLGVLMQSLVAPKPKASDVPCDVTLSWISPSFASTCDVYLGASQEAVNTASRTNPQGILVSQGQTVTTYHPAAPLKLSQAYYWRVDFVIAGLTPTIVKGPVLSFTTAGVTYPIKNITATASPSQVGMGPEKTVDGSGLDKSDGHSTNGTDMWLSTTAPHWIQYQFDKVYTLHELWVWNSNQPIESFIGFGAKTVKIECSTDGTTWTALANVPEFAKATGKAGYTASTIVSFAGVPAKYVKLTIEKAWGSTPSAGLSEVRFFRIQTAAVPKP